MLDPMDVLKMMADGKPLPQEKLPKPSNRTIDALQVAEPEILNDMFAAMNREEDPVDLMMGRLRELSGKHGWFATAGILCMSFATRYQPDQIPQMNGVTPETMSLLKMLPIAAKHSADDEGAWTIPMAILADLGEEEALGFTACAGLCAGVGHVQHAMEARAEGS
jgi:hypothetical protein